jgi:hypothetical protein
LAGTSLLPGTNNYFSLGSSSYRFANVYTTLLNVSGASTLTGAVTSSGRLTGVGLTNSGTKICTPTTYTIAASTTVTPTSELGLLTTVDGAVTWTATPHIATTTATNGQFYEIVSSTTSDITIGDNDSVSGSLVELHQNTASRVLANPGDAIAFRYYGGSWYEVYFSTH